MAVWPLESWFTGPTDRPFSNFLAQYNQHAHPDWACQIKWRGQPQMMEITDGSLIESRDFPKIDFAICLMKERSYYYFPDSERTRQAVYAVFGDFTIEEIDRSVLEIRLSPMAIWAEKIKADPGYLNLDEKKLLEMLVERLGSLDLRAICDGMVLL